jgi:hypothetical protein
MKQRTMSKAKATAMKQARADVAGLITQKEAAAMRGVTQAAIGDLIRRGRLRTVELFGRVLVYRSEVEGFERERPGPKTQSSVNQSKSASVARKR